MSYKEILTALILDSNGDWDVAYKNMIAKKTLSQQTIQQAKDLLKKFDEDGYKTIFVTDKNYPDILKEVVKPPFVISTKTKIVFKNNKTIMKNEVLIHFGLAPQDYVKSLQIIIGDKIK